MSCSTQYKRISSATGQERVRHILNNSPEGHAREGMSVSAVELESGTDVGDTSGNVEAPPISQREPTRDTVALSPLDLQTSRTPDETEPPNRALALNNEAVGLSDGGDIQMTPRSSTQLSRRDVEELEGLRHKSNKFLAEASEIIFPVVQKVLAQHSDLQRQRKDWIQSMTRRDPQTFRLLSGNSRFDLPSLDNLTLKRGNVRVHLQCDSHSPVNSIASDKPAEDKNTSVPNAAKVGNTRSRTSAVSSVSQSVSDETVSKVCSQCRRTESVQWRRGPNGPRTLCNPCGQRWRASLLETGAKRDPRSSTLTRRKTVGSVSPKKSKKKKSCLECGRTNSKRWLLGPKGSTTLCSACGTRWYRKMKGSR